jgi:DNA-directed RNA polymerase specialized sigma24 family protein
VRTVAGISGPESSCSGVGNVDNGQHSEYDGLRRAARLAASIAGAAGSDVEEIADEAMARLLMQDGLVNNPKAWVRGTATTLAAGAQTRQRIRPDDVLEELDPTERALVVGQRVGYSTRELAQKWGLSEETIRTLLAEANRKVRRSTRRFVDAGR